MAGELLGEAVERRHQLLEALPRVLDQVHLVDRHDHVGDTEQGADEGVALGLLEHPAAGVDQHHRDVGRRGPGDHVARVLPVAGAVGDDEPPPRGGEVAVGDVDRDALLALGSQAVGQQREIEGSVASAALARLCHLLELVLEHLLGVIEEPARSTCSCRRRPSRPS